MNVLVLNANGLNCHWLGPYGNEWVNTPAFDALACESVVFDQHFSDNLVNGEANALLPAAAIDRLRQAGITPLFVDDRKSRGGDDRPWAESIVTDPSSHAMPGEALIAAVQIAVKKLARSQSWLLCVETDRLTPPWDFEFETYQQYAEASGGFIEDRATEDEEPIDEPPIGPINLNDESLWHRLHNSFAAAVTSFDSELARLIDLFRQRGMDKSAAWVLTSGYGWPLGEHGVVGPQQSRLHEELVHLPLMIRLPEAREAMRRASAFTQTPDLAPTILEMFGLTVTGPSMLPLMAGKSTSSRGVCRICADRCDDFERALRTTDWAFLESAVDGPTRLYRKPDDIWEVNDLSQRQPDECDSLTALLNQEKST